MPVGRPGWVNQGIAVRSLCCEDRIGLCCGLRAVCEWLVRVCEGTKKGFGIFSEAFFVEDTNDTNPLPQNP